MKEISPLTAFIWLLACFLSGGEAARAADKDTMPPVKSLGVNGAWTAYTFNEGKDSVCYILARPERAEGNYQKRGDVHVMVTNRPGARQYSVVSIAAGYPYKSDAPVELVIDGTSTFTLTGHGETAWVHGVDDKAVVAAMKAGTTMVVTGTSARGTATTDTYSLSGITRSLTTIDARCKVPK